ncbi:tRNA pseudouridine synthase B [Pseudidiomarina planktonica]|uniref:tRNA pseudouridine synthase B n=1 Tax=Pseudidiomarina planktonica TaxID=1323738 RepID=A0A1Y6ET21_9GAMM|nr:tRNA pseudouridine(55) synthase TruB [Pseudidiomarina planktonica]RUO65667.1 tRNA pseudouridine(55) synthase TruB [Pseudidiomarina planktonica]SMQ63662.1 tRNA pseudouridine synthase B [Pseudidiomarina planktonica]
MARRKSGRPISGVVLLDKPTGITSNAALQQVRRFFNAKKAGHTGALDPLATGMLPVCLGEATKFSHYLLNADKAYRVTARLGQRTTTSDSEGDLVAEQVVDKTAEEIQQILPEFIGEQEQAPSMFSALKHEGRPLYYYARNGIEVPRKVRTITIYSIEFVSMENGDITLDVVASKGTYIRTLIDDLGQRLGFGAHVVALHRHWVAGLQELPMLTLEQLEQLVPAEQSENDQDYLALDAVLLASDSIISEMPVVLLNTADTAEFQHGMPVPVPDNLQEGAEYRIKRQADNLFLGIATAEPAPAGGFILAPKRVLNVGERLTQDHY